MNKTLWIIFKKYESKQQYVKKDKIKNNKKTEKLNSNSTIGFVHDSLQMRPDSKL